MFLLLLDVLYVFIVGMFVGDDDVVCVVFFFVGARFVEFVLYDVGSEGVME